MSEHRSIVITPACNSPRYNYVKVQYHHHHLDPLWCHCQTGHLDKKTNKDEIRKYTSCHLSDFSAKKR